MTGRSSRKPFGGNSPLNKLDFSELLSTENSPEQMLWLQVITQSAVDYLSFGLAKNGPTPEDFLGAYNYFFTVRSDRPETWSLRRVIRETAVDDQDGRKKTRVIMFTDSLLRSMCFDMHYEVCNFRLLHIDRFLQKLIGVRREALLKYESAVLAYLDELSERKRREASSGTWPHSRLARQDWLETLIAPKNGREMVELIYGQCDKPTPVQWPEFPAMMAAEWTAVSEEMERPLTPDTSVWDIFTDTEIRPNL
jgi:hypothetical protein